MSQLKDNNGQDYMPNTTADNVSYGNTNVAAKIAELEQGGGGSADNAGINLFDPADIVIGKGISNGGDIIAASTLSCVFIPLEYNSVYRMSGYLFYANGGDLSASNIALAKGTANSFTTLLVSDLKNGCDWLDMDASFPHQGKLWRFAIKDQLTFRTPAMGEMADETVKIGLVINTTFNGVTPTNDTLSVVKSAYAGIVSSKNVAFFGDSITDGKIVPGDDFVGIVWAKCAMGFVYNYGSSGAATPRLASIMLNDDFREDVPDNPKDYTKLDAVVIQIGTNGSVASYIQGHSADINADIPDIGVYDISEYPYEYSASGKTISSATLNNAKEFFTKCFANTFYGNLALCIEYMRYINPNCRIFLTTIPHNIGAGSFDNVRTALLNLAAKMGVQVIDAGAYAGLGVWNIKYWSRDNAIHFNAKGAEMWSSYIANELEKKFYETEL